MAYRQSDSQRRNDTVRFDLMEKIGVLSVKENGWSREVNIVSWNNGAAKVDIREWDPDHKRMTKGVTLFEDEAETLTKLLAKRYGISLKGGGPADRFIARAESDHFGADRSGGSSFEAEAGASADEAAEDAAVQHDGFGAATAAEAAAADLSTSAASPAGEACAEESSLYMN